MGNINKPLIITIAIIAVIFIIAYIVYSKNKQSTVAAETILESKKNLPETVKRLNNEISELESCRNEVKNNSSTQTTSVITKGGVMSQDTSKYTCFSKYRGLYVGLVANEAGITTISMNKADTDKTLSNFDAEIKSRKDLLIEIQK